MLLQKMLEEFAKKSPPTVMAQATMAHALSAERVNRLFEATAEVQYTRALTFATLVDLMAPVVCGTHPSVHAAYQRNKEEIGASIAAVYEKLRGIEPAVCEELVRDVTGRLAAVIDQMPKGKRPPLLRGYRTLILDGNCLAASEHRIEELRQTAAGPLPGKSLVVLDPERMLALDVVLCEDGHAQERSLLEPVIQRARKRDLWIADRNFCTLGFLNALAGKGASFVIRLHGGLPYTEAGAWREIGRTSSGYTCEREVRIDDGAGGTRTLRLVRVNLTTPTRDGEETLYLLINLPESAADAGKVAELYRERWLLEKAFFHLTESLRCEVNTLGYPKAALFAFAVALLAYNVLAVTRAALRAKWGATVGDEELSTYYLTDEIAGVHRGMMIALPDQTWSQFESASAAAVAAELMAWAGNLNPAHYRKHPRGPKKPPPPRASDPRHPHVSTKKLLDAPSSKVKAKTRKKKAP